MIERNICGYKWLTESPSTYYLKGHPEIVAYYDGVAWKMHQFPEAGRHAYLEDLIKEMIEWGELLIGVA